MCRPTAARRFSDGLAAVDMLRLKLARMLRRDLIARWFDAPLDIVALSRSTLATSAVPRTVVIPPGVEHYYDPPNATSDSRTWV